MINAIILIGQMTCLNEHGHAEILSFLPIIFSKRCQKFSCAAYIDSFL